MTMKLNELKKDLLKRADVRAEYDALAEEFSMKERYLNDPEYREAKKAYARAYGKIWRQEKKELTRVHTIARRARLVEADGTNTAADIARIHEDQGFCCVYCETSTIDSYHVDHKTPLSRGGSNGPENIQILCPHCNVSKWSRTDEEFREWRSRLVPANDNTGVDEEETG